MLALSEWSRLIIQMTDCAVGVVEESKDTSTTIGNENLHSHHKNQYDSTTEIWKLIYSKIQLYTIRHITK